MIRIIKLNFSNNNNKDLVLIARIKTMSNRQLNNKPLNKIIRANQYHKDFRWTYNLTSKKNKDYIIIKTKNIKLSPYKVTIEK